MTKRETIKFIVQMIASIATNQKQTGKKNNYPLNGG